MATDFNHPIVGRIAVYRDPFKARAEQGQITSVNEDAGLVFVRYSGATSAATNADERLTFLDGSLVSAALRSAS